VKLVFMGTPAFAVPALLRLCERGLRPAAVYAQPARQAGRGLKLVQPPVAQAAQELGLELRQPETLQTKTELAFLADLAPDVIVTAAYGKIFRRRLLELPRLGCINLHPSLLPRYRGLSPIPWAILRGDDGTGVTVYRMEEGVDSGPILFQRTEPIRPDDTAHTLGERLGQLGADLLCRAIQSLAGGELAPRPQDEAAASYAPRLERDHGRLDWRLPAAQVDRLVRALDPWPGTFCFLGGARVKILAVEAVDLVPRRAAPGTMLRAGGREAPLVAALPGAVALRRVQRENCRPQDGEAFCCGQRLQAGCRLTPYPACPEVPAHD
jgi:methionyl-tRNA formyltransferase